MTSIGILGMEYYLPEKERFVADIFKEEAIPLGSLSKEVDFQKDIGIETVRVADALPSELALKAAQKVMASTETDPHDVGVVVGFSSLPEDYVGPTWSLAGLVQERLGLKYAFATAVNTGGCASYHVALKATCALMMSTEKIQTALVVAGDCTPHLNKTYYPITVASDAGAALILRKYYDQRLILSIETYSMGRLHDVWYVPGLPDKKPDGPVYERSLHMHCNMEKFNKGVIPVNFFMFRKVIDSVLNRVRMSIGDIDFFVYPSFSTWDQSYFMKAIGVPPEKVYLDNLKRIGHTQECDMVINYVDAVSSGRIRKGNTVMVISNGAGFAWSAVVVRH